MRYKITNKLKELIKENKKELLRWNKKLKWPIKNVLYNTISISDDLLNEICDILKINKKILNLKKIEFHKEKNFGDYSNPINVKFNGVNEDFAEFIGIMLGDGNIYRNSVRIMMDKRETDYKNYIKTLFYRLFKLKLNEYESKNSNQFRLYKDSKNLTNLLTKYGLKRGNKIKNQVSIPSWILKNNSYISRCIRGLMDTDGCVYWDKRDKKTYIKFTNSSLKLLKDFKLFAKSIGINFVKSGKTNIALYRKSEIEKYIKQIGFSNEKHKEKVSYFSMGPL